MDDYSGEFVPKLKLRDFSPSALAELLTLYAKLYLAMDASWYLAVKGRLGNQEALACDLQAWENMCKYEMAIIKRRLKIRGNDITSFVKATQLCPWFQLIESKIEINGKNSASLTVTYCPTLNALEQEGMGREEQICNIVEPEILKGCASVFNPDIQVRCLKSPPRKSKGDICCKWEFSL